MSRLGSIFSGPGGRIVLLCLLQTLLFGYACWNEWKRGRTGWQRNLAWSLLVVGVVGSLDVTVSSSIDAAHEAQQRDADFQRTQDLALRAAELSHVATLNKDEQQRITTLMRPFARMKTSLTCVPGTSYFCDRLNDALRAAKLEVDYVPNFNNQGAYVGVGPVSIPHRIMVTALRSAVGASDRLVTELKQQRFDVGVPDPKQWTKAAQDGYATKSVDPFPLQIFVNP